MSERMPEQASSTITGPLGSWRTLPSRVMANPRKSKVWKTTMDTFVSKKVLTACSAKLKRGAESIQISAGKTKKLTSRRRA